MSTQSGSGRPKPARAIDSFRGDYAALASMMERAWSHDSGAFLYTPDYLRSVLTSPGAGPSLAPTLYENDEPKGFASGFPRRVLLEGRSISIVVSANLTITPAYQKLGMGGVLLGDLIKRAQAEGHDGMMQYCIAGGPMNGIVLGLGRALGIPTQQVQTIAYLSRTLFPKGAAAPQLEEDPPERETAPEMLMELAAEVARGTRLARQWSRADAQWQCSRDGAVVAQLVVGPRRGLLTGYIMQVAAGDLPKCLIIDDILWGSLEDSERALLVKALLQKAAAAGARLAIAPVLGYADTAPLTAAHFRQSNRVLHAYLSVWTGKPPTETLPSMYLDVF